MNEEDKKTQKHLVDEMMKVSKTNPDVMYYMQALMEKYEQMEKENQKLKAERNTYKSKCDNLTNVAKVMLTGKSYNDLVKENQKLNKIIDELEKHICSEWYCFDNESVEVEVAKDILNKLTELKKEVE